MKKFRRHCSEVLSSFGLSWEAQQGFRDVRTVNLSFQPFRRRPCFALSGFLFKMVYEKHVHMMKFTLIWQHQQLSNYCCTPEINTTSGVNYTSKNVIPLGVQPPSAGKAGSPLPPAPFSPKAPTCPCAADRLPPRSAPLTSAPFIPRPPECRLSSITQYGAFSVRLLALSLMLRGKPLFIC